MAEKLSERVKQHFGTLRFRGVFGEMAERIEALEEWRMRGGVEAVEPEDTDAIIRKLREERDGANERLEIRRTLCHSWEGRCHRTERELAKAKAEIERLRKERDNTEQDTRCCVACLEELKADAALGRLVRGMPIDTKIRHHHPKIYRDPIFTVYRWSQREMTFVNVAWSTDPAKALCSIQEVGDAEA